jgi:hypothetical protein
VNEIKPKPWMEQLARAIQDKFVEELGRPGGGVLESDLAMMIATAYAEGVFEESKEKPASDIQTLGSGPGGPKCHSCGAFPLKIQRSETTKTPDGAMFRMSWCLACGVDIAEQMVRPPIPAQETSLISKPGRRPRPV